MLKRESLSFGITLSPKSTVPVLVERLSSITSGESVIDGTKIFGSKLTQAVRGNVSQRKQNREKFFIVQSFRVCTTIRDAVTRTSKVGMGIQ